MNKKLYFFSIFFLMLIVLFNCNAQKTNTHPQAVEQPNSQNPPVKKIKFALIISFTSHASGIDGEKYDAIMKYIQAYPKKIVYKQYFWGREGERDICMNLKELKKSERKSFIDEIKKIANGSDRVLINENVTKEFVLDKLK